MRRILFALPLLIFAACAEDKLSEPVIEDTDRPDLDAAEDGSGTADSGDNDAATDAGVEETTAEDTAPDGSADTTLPDTTASDTEVDDTTLDDTTLEDTAVDDTTPPDTTPDAPEDRCSAGISVTQLTDSIDADGACSLREAVLVAVGSPANGDCATGSEPGLITLSSGTYTLTIAGAGEDLGRTGDLDIAGDVALLGCPAATISATGQDRIFDIPAGAALSLVGLELIGGSVTGEGGGAIRANGTLDGTDLTFRNNRTIGGDGASGSSPGGGGGGGGGAALGGAIFSDHGTVRLTGTAAGLCTFASNEALGGRGGNGPPNGGSFEGVGGGGGGLTGGTAGTASTAGGIGGFGGGGGGGGSGSGTPGAGGAGGYGGGGGGGGARTGGGDAGAGGTSTYAGGSGGTGCCSAGSGGGGGAALGGAIFLLAGGTLPGGTLEVDSCTFDSNAATGGAPGGNGYGGPAPTAGSGYGGAIFAEGWTPILTAPLFINNMASTSGTDLYAR